MTIDYGHKPSPERDVMRQEYRTLDSDTRGHVENIKTLGEELWQYLHSLDDCTGKYDARCIRLAKTKLEEAVLWATKGVT